MQDIYRLPAEEELTDYKLTTFIARHRRRVYVPVSASERCL
ncbi:MAG: hypothetical protein ACLR6Z_00425 [Dorea sp.]